MGFDCLLKTYENYQPGLIYARHFCQYYNYNLGFFVSFFVEIALITCNLPKTSLNYSFSVIHSILMFETGNDHLIEFQLIEIVFYHLIKIMLIT